MPQKARNSAVRDDRRRSPGPVWVPDRRCEIMEGPRPVLAGGRDKGRERRSLRP